VNDRRTYQREVAELLDEVERQAQRRYRLEAAGARGPALAEDGDARERLARLIEAA
jgi:hypothetical protein